MDCKLSAADLQLAARTLRAQVILGPACVTRNGAGMGEFPTCMDAADVVPEIQRTPDRNGAAVARRAFSHAAWQRHSHNASMVRARTAARKARRTEEWGDVGYVEFPDILPDSAACSDVASDGGEVLGTVEAHVGTSAEKVASDDEVEPAASVCYRVAVARVELAGLRQGGESVEVEAVEAAFLASEVVRAGPTESPPTGADVLGLEDSTDEDAHERNSGFGAQDSPRLPISSAAVLASTAIAPTLGIVPGVIVRTYWFHHNPSTFADRLRSACADVGKPTPRGHLPFSPRNLGLSANAWMRTGIYMQYPLMCLALSSPRICAASFDSIISAISTRAGVTRTLVSRGIGNAVRAYHSVTFPYLPEPTHDDIFPLAPRTLGIGARFFPAYVFPYIYIFMEDMSMRKRSAAAVAAAAAAAVVGDSYNDFGVTPYFDPTDVYFNNLQLYETALAMSIAGSAGVERGWREMVHAQLSANLTSARAQSTNRLRTRMRLVQADRDQLAEDLRKMRGAAGGRRPDAKKKRKRNGSSV